MSKYIISIYDSNDLKKWSKEYEDDQMGAMMMTEKIMMGFRNNPKGYELDGITIYMEDKLKVEFE
jgi:alpha-mannosidase